ncbi:MAG: hypothetical protein AUI36_43370 [Cyanobacteria bacterium 13_1_40CM_2_61_4]|nr:MAG: hypothetical protein AUI36_43370 [Cyanobacteria bacterium 13_1_40CM_2_61_4]
MFRDIPFRRFTGWKPCYPMDYSVNRYKIAVCRFGNKISKVEPATASVHGRPLPSQSPVAGWAKIDEKAAMDRACCDEAQIPDSPPDRALPKTSGTQAWTLIIQIVGAYRFTVERSLIEPIPLDVAVAHRSPLLRIQTQDMGNLLDSVFPI